MKNPGGLTDAQRTRIKWAIPLSIVLWGVIVALVVYL